MWQVRVQSSDRYFDNNLVVIYNWLPIPSIGGHGSELEGGSRKVLGGGSLGELRGGVIS